MEKYLPTGYFMQKVRRDMRVSERERERGHWRGVERE